MMLVYYDQTGTPRAYTINGVDIYLFSGEPAAYIEQDMVYAFSGKQLGWSWDGWIRDLNGYCVFFTPYATGGVYKPYMGFVPYAAYRQYLPYKSYRQYPQMRPYKKNAWSNLSGLAFFEQ